MSFYFFKYFIKNSWSESSETRRNFRRSVVVKKSGATQVNDSYSYCKISHDYNISEGFKPSSRSNENNEATQGAEFSLHTIISTS